MATPAATDPTVNETTDATKPTKTVRPSRSNCPIDKIMIVTAGGKLLKGSGSSITKPSPVMTKPSAMVKIGLFINVQRGFTHFSIKTTYWIHRPRTWWALADLIWRWVNALGNEGESNPTIICKPSTKIIKPTTTEMPGIKPNPAKRISMPPNERRPRRERIAATVVDSSGSSLRTSSNSTDVLRGRWFGCDSGVIVNLLC